MIYQSTTGISEGTNKRMMRNPFPPAGLAGLVPLVVITTGVFLDILLFFLVLCCSWWDCFLDKLFFFIGCSWPLQQKYGLKWS